MIELAEAQQQTNGWDALIVIAIFAFLGFFVWVIFRD